MARAKLYFKSKSEALLVAKERNERKFSNSIGVYKMVKGTRHHGMYFVGTYLEWLHFAN